MKKLKTYESHRSQTKENYLKELCEDLLIELSDKGFEVLVSVKIQSPISYSPSHIHIQISKTVGVNNPYEEGPFNTFQWSELENCAERVSEVLKDSGFLARGEFGLTRSEAIRRPENFQIRAVKTTTDLWFYQSLNVSEELKSDVYQRAADILTKKGHTKRPAELKKWAETTKKREDEERKKPIVDEAKQFSNPMEVEIISKEGTQAGLFYPRLSFDRDRLWDTWNDFIRGDANLWLCFSIGFIPADEETKRKVDELGIANSDGICWVGDMEMHLLNSLDSYDEIETFKQDPKINPDGRVSIDYYQDSVWMKISKRKSAVEFKKFLINVFSSKESYRPDSKYPGGLIHELQDILCDVYDVKYDGFLQFLKGIKDININSLYKD